MNIYTPTVSPGVVSINGLEYRLARDTESPNQPAYERSLKAEPPWDQAEPEMLSESTFTWHMGAFKSRQGIQGSYEYSENLDPRWPFRIVPAPKVNTVQLNTDAGLIASIVDGEGEGGGWFFAATNSPWNIYRIDLSLNVVLSIDEAGLDSLNVSKVFTWGGQTYAMAGGNRVYLLTSLNSGGPDTWEDDPGGITLVEAADIVQANNRLFKIDFEANNTTRLKNIVPGLDIRDEDNWADEVIIPGAPVAVYAFESTAIVLTTDGLYAVDDDGKAVQILKRLGSSVTVAASIEPYLYAVHTHGIMRWLPGLAESVGVELELINESPVRGRILNLTPVGAWIYTAQLDVVSNQIRINAGRDRKGDPGFGPIIWHTLATIDTNWLSRDNYPLDWFDVGFGQILAFDASDGTSATTLGYYFFPTAQTFPMIDSTSYRFSTSGQLFSYRYRFNDWHDKDNVKFDIQGKNLSETIYYEVAYSLDGGTFLTLDLDGNSMRIDDDDLHTFTLPATAVGREIQYRFTYTSDDDTVQGSLIFFEPFARPKSTKTVVHRMVLSLEDNQHLAGGIEYRDSFTALQNLETLANDADSVEVVFPWHETIKARVSNVLVSRVTQSGNNPHGYLVQVQLEER